MVRIRTARIAAARAGGTARSLRQALPSGYPILETKLARPRWRHLISRPRLLERLDAERDVPLVAAIAPAGYGKTALLADWAGRSARRAAWVTLDDRDTDPLVLLGYLAVAVDRATGLDPAVFETLATPDPSIWTTAVPQLGGALAATPEPFLLVVDEADRLGASHAFEALVALASHLAPGSQLALAMRAADGLPIPRLLAAEMMTVVARDDLALDDREAAELLEAEGTPLPAEEVRAINRAAEGWAAGISLRALAEHAGRAEPAGADPRATTERLVAEYVRSEVLDRLPQGDVRFLLRASILDRLSASLAAAVLDDDGAGATLRALGASTLLLTQIDERGEWYRWHRMIRDVLRTELSRREPDLVPVLNERAAVWHEAAGQFETAVEYAMRAGDAERVNRLLPGVAEAAYNAGRVEAVRAWFEWLETRGESVTAAIASVGTVLLALIGDAGRAHRWSAIAAGIDAGPASHEEGVCAVARVFLAQDGAGRMRQDAELAVRDLPPPHGWAPAAHVVHGVALALACAEDADRELAIGIELAMVAGGARTAAAIGLAFRAALAIERAAWTAADEQIRQARRIVLDAGLVDHAAGIAVHALAARIAAHRGAVRQAESDARHAERLRSTLTYATPWLAIRVRLDLGATLLALADPAGARVMADEIGEILRWQPEMGSLVEEYDELRMHVKASTAGWPPSSSLTAAELRLLPLLATHLSFRQIATSRNVSANTVKTQAKSIYRKLDAGSRSDAVEHARAYGLLEPATVLEQFAPTPQARA